MNEFWTNISRYPKFFISSVTGLILIILTPFRTLFKTKKLRFILVSLLILFLISFFIVIKTMLAL